MSFRVSCSAQNVTPWSRGHVRGRTTIWDRFPTSSPSIHGKTVEKVVKTGCSRMLILRQNQPLLRQFHHRWRGWRLEIDSRLLSDPRHDLYSTQQQSGTDWRAANSCGTEIYSATPLSRIFLNNYLHIMYELCCMISGLMKNSDL